jgi:iron-sulfur cluster assembly protein
MITITPAAAEKIRQAAATASAETPLLRVAVQQLADGTLDYGMGFDQERPGDAFIEIDGIMVVIAPPSRELIEGTRIDFVEIEPGEYRFIFAAPEVPGAGGAPGES